MSSGRYGQFLTSWVGFNPAVLVLELRTRWRGVKPFVALTVCALLPVLVFALMAGVQSYRVGSVAEGGAFATGIVVPTAYMLLLLLLVIIPVQAAGAMALEPTTRTLEPLRAALLTPGDVLWGKLLATLAQALLLVLTALPVLTWSLLLGGSSLRGIAYALSYLFALAIMLACTGLAVASLLSRLTAAIPATYTVVAFAFAAGPGLGRFLQARENATLARGFSVGDSSRVMDAGPALFVVLCLGAVIGVMAYLGFRNLVSRLVAGASRDFANALAAIFAILAGGALMRLVSAQLLPWLAHAEWQRLLGLHPFAVISGLLGSDEDLGVMQLLGYTVSYQAARWWLWFTATTLALGWSVLAWVIARRTYEAKLGPAP